jgi:hypothetical protein
MIVGSARPSLFLLEDFISTNARVAFLFDLIIDSIFTSGLDSFYFGWVNYCAD